MRSWNSQREGRVKTRRRLVATTLVLGAFAALAAPVAASATVGEERVAINDVPVAVGACLNSEGELAIQQSDDSYRAAAAAMGLFIPRVTQNGATRVVAQGSGHNLRLQFTYDLTVNTSGDVTVQDLSIEQLCVV
jgi:hypothetical protein